MILRVFVVLFGALSLLSCPSWSQEVDMEHRPFAIGEIDYFGYGGIPLAKVRAAVPWHAGDTLTFATFSKTPLEEAITRVVGKPPTDVNIVCCDPSMHLEIYIGLPGSTMRPVPTASAPSSDTHLDAEGLSLYQREQPLLAQAASRGTAGEDDSTGYMVSKDPDLKAMNLAMRAYALDREPELRKVLQTAANSEDRRAAATLLGYVRRSATQAEALSQAVIDPDSEVRNNAVRALAVLSAASTGEHPNINVKPLVDLLYSGSWTDRNKASLLLFRLTDRRDPDVLRALRDSALPALIEGASWVDVPGHSTPFLVILGRIGGIPDQELGSLLKSGDSAHVIAAATAARERTQQ